MYRILEFMPVSTLSKLRLRRLHELYNRGNGNPALANPETNIGDHRMKTNRTQQQKDQEIFLIENLLNVIDTMKRGTRGSQFRGQGRRLGFLLYEL